MGRMGQGGSPLKTDLLLENGGMEDSGDDVSELIECWRVFVESGKFR